MADIDVRLGKAGIERLQRGEVLRETIPGMPAFALSFDPREAIVVEVTSEDAGPVDGYEDETL